MLHEEQVGSILETTPSYYLHTHAWKKKPFKPQMYCLLMKYNLTLLSHIETFKKGFQRFTFIIVFPSMQTYYALLLLNICLICLHLLKKSIIYPFIFPHQTSIA